MPKTHTPKTTPPMSEHEWTHRRGVVAGALQTMPPNVILEITREVFAQATDPIEAIRRLCVTVQDFVIAQARDPELRRARPHAINLYVQPKVSYTTKQGMVAFSWGSHDVVDLAEEDARDLALELLSAIEAAQLEASFLQTFADLNPNQIGRMINDLRHARGYDVPKLIVGAVQTPLTA